MLLCASECTEKFCTNNNLEFLGTCAADRNQIRIFSCDDKVINSENCIELRVEKVQCNNVACVARSLTV